MNDIQELEKILEKIEALQDISGWDLLTVQGILEIIRKHINDGWIPADERLPEKWSTVLVVDKYNYYFVAVFDGIQFRIMDCYGDYKNIVAWSELNPYKEGDNK